MPGPRSLLLVALAGLPVLLAGCSRPAAPPAAQPPPLRPSADAAGGTGVAGQALPLTVRLTYSEKACYLPVVVAIEEGFYAAEGLKVESKVVTGGIESAEALISGQADVGTMGDAPTAIVLSRSPNFRLICNQAVGERMHRIVVRNDSGIKTPRDLQGKRVAVQLGSSTHGAFLLYCRKHDVDVSKVNFVSLSPRDFPEAMVARQVDAIAGSEPWPGNVMAKCKDSHELANLKGLGNNYPLPIIADVRFLQAHPTVAAALVRGTRKAIELITADPKRAVGALAAKSGVPAERELKGRADYDFTVDLDEATVSSLQKTAEFLKSQKKIDKVPDVAALVDRSGLEAVGTSTTKASGEAPR